MVVSERDEELTLFLELRRREKEKSNLLVRNSDVFAPPLGSNGGGVAVPVSEVLPSVPPRKTAAEKFLYSENDKSDYDWLLTPPGTPLLPMETRSHKSLMNQTTVPSTRPTALKLKLENLQEEPDSMSRVVLKNSSLPSRLHSSDLSNRNPSSALASGATKSYGRSATPTARPTMTKPSRSVTPGSRASFPSARPAASISRAITPSRSSSRSSTPTSRPSAPSSKSVSRSATPTRQPMASTSFPGTSVRPARSSSVAKSAPNTVKNPPPARAPSPTVKSRPWKPSEMPGFSLDAPPNLRTSIPDRPVSATRGRPGSRSSSIEAGSNGRPRRQSCSPSRVRPSTSSSNSNGSSITSVRRRDSRSNDNESPALIGTKMVERVVNMRKLAPPRQASSRYNPEAKLTSSLDGSSFGSTLSKKSLDMAMRHMDIRRSISTNGNLRPLVTKVPASSVYSVRSRSTRSRTTGVSDSPLATSSNASSEPSVNNNFISFDGSEMEENDVCSERGF